MNGTAANVAMGLSYRLLGKDCPCEVQNAQRSKISDSLGFACRPGNRDYRARWPYA